MSIPVDGLDVLVVAPHPDDAEISVGGTIVTSLQQNLSVGVLELTDGEPTPHGSREKRATETSDGSSRSDMERQPRVTKSATSTHA